MPQRVSSGVTAAASATLRKISVMEARWRNVACRRRRKRVWRRNGGGRQQAAGEINDNEEYQASGGSGNNKNNLAAGARACASRIIALRCSRAALLAAIMTRQHSANKRCGQHRAVHKAAYQLAWQWRNGRRWRLAS